MDRKSTLPYVIGFSLAVVLTLIAYLVAAESLLPAEFMPVMLMSLAAVQLLVQLVFFLHLGRSKENRWHSAAFYFMLIILLVIVVGSLWIMYNMNYNMMSPEHMNDYMLKENSKGF